MAATKARRTENKRWKWEGEVASFILQKGRISGDALRSSGRVLYLEVRVTLGSGKKSRILYKGFLSP
jgi:hypothetical protein